MRNTCGLARLDPGRGLVVLLQASEIAQSRKIETWVPALVLADIFSVCDLCTDLDCCHLTVFPEIPLRDRKSVV